MRNPTNGKLRFIDRNSKRILQQFNKGKWKDVPQEESHQQLIRKNLVGIQNGIQCGLKDAGTEVRIYHTKLPSLEAKKYYHHNERSIGCRVAYVLLKDSDIKFFDVDPPRR